MDDKTVEGILKELAEREHYALMIRDTERNIDDAKLALDTHYREKYKALVPEKRKGPKGQNGTSRDEDYFLVAGFNEAINKMMENINE